MLTRREILMQLKRMGVKELSLLKQQCRDFESYATAHYGFEIVKKGASRGESALFDPEGS